MDIWCDYRNFAVTVFLAVIAIFSSGCVSDSKLHYRDTAVNSELIKKLLEKSEIEVADSQFQYWSKSPTGTDILDRYDVKKVAKAESVLKFVFEECVLQKSFWQKGKSLLSAVTLTVIPVSNEYSCKTRLEVTNDGLKRTFFIERPVTQSFGIITSLFLGLVQGPRALQFKYANIDVLLSEATK